MKLTPFAVGVFALSTVVRADKPEGIVYESEVISAPASAWILNQRSSDHWMLWTQEDDIGKKRSGGAVLVSPTVTKDRAAPGEGAPPLHSVVQDLKPGTYLVFVSPPGGRPLGYSLDGKNWFRHAGGELALGARRIDGEFELWVDDRYACPPENPGGAYYDYIRFVPAPESALETARAKYEYIETWSEREGSVDLCWTTSVAMATGAVEYWERGRPSSFPAAGENIASSGQLIRNHRVRLSGLDPAKEYEGKITTLHRGEPMVSGPIKFRAAPLTPPPTKPQVIPLTVPEITRQARSAWPATVGIPFGRGMLADVRDLRLLDRAGRGQQLQAELQSRWPDGSVQWCVVSFLADTKAGDQLAGYRLEARPNGEPAAHSPDILSVSESKEGWSLRAERLSLEVSKRGTSLFRSGNTPATKLQLVRADGQMLSAGPPDGDGLRIESNGPVRAVVRWSGPLVDAAGKASWRYLVRATIWKGQAVIGLDLSVTNDQPTPRFAAIRRLELQVPFDAGRIRGAIGDAASRAIEGQDAISVLQDKEDHFQQGGMPVEGKHAAGYVQAASDSVRIAAILPEFWQTYPKGFAIAADGIRVELLPPLPPDAYSDAASLKVFHRLYAWFDKGNYLFRAGQLTRNQVVLCYGAPADPLDLAQLSDWFAHPLIPQAPPEYLCGTGVLGRRIFPVAAGVWDQYDNGFAKLFETSLRERDKVGTYGWMNYGDWFGERVLNYGNNEYDMAWSLAVQWMRTGRREYFDRGQQMARHYSSVDTIYGKFAEAMNGLVYEHSFNHVGTELTPTQLHLVAAAQKGESYLAEYGTSMFHGAIDRQGHVFQEGNWLYAALTGDRFLWDAAQRICINQAEKLTPSFDFGIERAGGWPIINAAAAYRHTGNPYYLNAARLMVQRCLARQDPATGGWLHRPPLSETGGEAILGGKAFAVGILSNGILRYLDQEPTPRPDVRQMLVRGADFLMNESWVSGKGFRYISNCAKYRDTGGRGNTSLLNCEIIAFAFQETKQEKYRDFWVDMMGDELAKSSGGIGKDFTQRVRQTVFGLDRALEWGWKAIPAR